MFNFQQVNNTASGRWRVNRGIRNVRKRGQLISYEGQPNLTVWAGRSCNVIHGGDTYLYEGMRRPKQALWVHEVSLCRSVELTYIENIRLMGLDVQSYTWNIDDIGNNQKLRCYCRDSAHCPVNGTLDLYPCYKFPMTATKPHFLDADESVVEKVTGLTPNRQTHAVELLLEMVGVTGTMEMRLINGYNQFLTITGDWTAGDCIQTDTIQL